MTRSLQRPAGGVKPARGLGSVANAMAELGGRRCELVPGRDVFRAKKES